MNSRTMNSFVFAVLAAVALLCGTRKAQAIEMSVQILNISQAAPYSSSVRLGHLVSAKTYMISVQAGGSFRVVCPGAVTGTIEGQNLVPQTGVPPNVLTVEVPAGWLPAERELPGFNNVPDDTTLTCSYFWTAVAKEAMYSLGGGGSSLPVGGDAYSRQDSVTFVMYKPGSGSKDNNGCIH